MSEEKTRRIKSTRSVGAIRLQHALAHPPSSNIRAKLSATCGLGVRSHRLKFRYVLGRYRHGHEFVRPIYGKNGNAILQHSNSIQFHDGMLLRCGHGGVFPLEVGGRNSRIIRQEYQPTETPDSILLDEFMFISIKQMIEWLRIPQSGGNLERVDAHVFAQISAKEITNHPIREYFFC